MRSPFSFMRSSSTVVTVGFFSSAMGHRRCVELGDLAEPEITSGKLGMRNRQTGLAHRPLAEPHDVEIERALGAAHARSRHRAVRGQERLRREGRLEQYHLIQ